MYYSYHNTAKKLIREGRLAGYAFVDSYKNIKPALVLDFVTEKGLVRMPIRQHRWQEYIELIGQNPKIT